MVKNVDSISFENLPVKTVDTLLSSENIKGLFKEIFSARNPIELLWYYFIDKSAPFGKTFLDCFPIVIEGKSFSDWIDCLLDKQNRENLLYFCAAFWSRFDHSQKVIVIKNVILGFQPGPFLKILDGDVSETFRLSELISDKSKNRLSAVELASFCECVQVDSLPNFPQFTVNVEFAKAMKGFSNNVVPFSQETSFDLNSYTWAVKYCVIKDNFKLMIQLGFHFLLDIKLEKSSCTYINIALEMASFILCNNRLPFVLPNDLVHLIVRARFEEAKCALRNVYRI